MRAERTRQRPSVDRLHHRRLNLDIAATLWKQWRAGSRMILSRVTNVSPDRIVADQVQGSLPVTHLHVLQPVELLREVGGRSWRGTPVQDARDNVSSPGPVVRKTRPSDADQVARIKQFVELEIALPRLRPSANVQLDLNPALLDIGETGLALAPLPRQAAANPSARTVLSRSRLSPSHRVEERTANLVYRGALRCTCAGSAQNPSFADASRSCRSAA